MGICPTTNEPCNCNDPKLYAGDLCWNLYRKRYQDKPYATNPEAKRRYELSDKGRRRRYRYNKKVRAIAKLTGAKSLGVAFGNPDHIRALQQALQKGDRTLMEVWSMLNPDHRQLIRGNSDRKSC
jgi:hypothetical protein